MPLDFEDLSRELIALEPAAALIGRRPGTLRMAAEHGRLRAVKVGRDWVTTREELARYVAVNRRRRTRA